MYGHSIILLKEEYVYGLYKICNFMVDVFVSVRFLC